MIHVYTGDGKGKTTAALGLAMRAAGRGKRVAIVQFNKGRETGELFSLARLPNVAVYRNHEDYGFFSALSKEIQEKVVSENNENLRTALAGDWDLLVLDEAIGAYNYGTLDRTAIDALIAEVKASSGAAAEPGAALVERELVLTGRNAPESFLEAADYVSEIRKVKHPYNAGIRAREGIEY